MAAKTKHIGIKILVQIFSVELCDFFNLFQAYKRNDFSLENFLSVLPLPRTRNLDLTKTGFSKYFLPKK